MVADVPPPRTIGVAGAGTMGAGIAQLGAQSGARTLLHDPDPAALERGLEGVLAALRRGVERGRWSEDEAEAAGERIEAAPTLGDLAACDLVIEAAPESVALKTELFGALSEVVSPECVLATNTSSLQVTALAGAATHPERVVGMHFFNPAPVMRLVEVVAGERSSKAALALARAAGEAMGKRVINASDGPGFLVNRCGRPFGLEALRLLSERVATVEQIDRVCRLGGGFRMGPFELMDLVGVDVGLAVSKSFYEQSFGEPRWRPSPIAARMTAAGRHGRKVGHGYYDYTGSEHRPPDPADPPGGGGHGVVVIAGAGTLAREIAEAGVQAGWTMATPAEAEGDVPALIVDCGAEEDDPPLQGGPRAVLCAAGSLAALDPGGGAIGFHALPPFGSVRLVELCHGADTAASAVEATQRFFASLGRQVEWVSDAPGLVLGRIVCQLVNEAAFALQEGVGSAEEIDAGLLLGLNFPHGPLLWGDEIGLDHVLAVLDGLSDEHREERYRAAPLLRRHVLEGRLGRETGAGFFSYD